MAYTASVRQSLRNKGISDNRIGYSNGGVTVDNKLFMKPERTFSGASYTSPESFNAAWSSYNSNRQQPNTNSNMGAGLSGASGMGTSGTSGSPYSGTSVQTPQPYQQPQQHNYFDTYNQMVSKPYDPYSSAQYAAYQAQTQKNAHEGIRAAQESMGSSGFGRSTALGERAQGIQNDANAYLETQVIPQLYAQEEARRQQEFQNAYNLQTADRNYGIQVGELTGSFMPPEAKQAIDYLNNLKATTEQNWMNMTPEQRTAAQTEGNRIRAQLQGMNIDPSLFGANVNSNTAMGNVGHAGIQTQHAREFDQQMAYQASRDKIADSRYKAEFDEDARRWGIEFALDKAVKNRQLSQEDARIALARASEARQAANAARSAGQQDQGLLFDIWQNTGFAPAGIPGVREGTPIYEKPTAAQKDASFIGPPVDSTTKTPKLDPKDSLDNFEYYQGEISGYKGITKAEAIKYVEGEKANLTAADYKALKTWIAENYK